ncbi:MAG: type II 3-dehydroquinate dehydratase [Deltaproteobacteria bacterium RIFCSPHIGHO2_12_FULL_43_9]|nr:MAG: type II 3-dehydroquinate dehydratase [Deltaproteobacteria bacterium RIFCSPHIGHO2_12_FULL_43_9]
MKRCLVIHGPNLNLLGTREKPIYGILPLTELDKKLVEKGKTLNIEVVSKQSNHEGEIVTWIQEVGNLADGLIINPAAYGHTSIAIRDAIAATNIPTIEIHMTNISSRELFRRNSIISDVVCGRIEGFGWRSYIYGLEAISDLIN